MEGILGNFLHKKQGFFWEGILENFLHEKQGFFCLPKIWGNLGKEFWGIFCTKNRDFFVCLKFGEIFVCLKFGEILGKEFWGIFCTKNRDFFVCLKFGEILGKEFWGIFCTKNRDFLSCLTIPIYIQLIPNMRLESYTSRVLDIPKYRANKKMRFNKLGLLHKIL